jgi:hypothetical protein
LFPSEGSIGHFDPAEGTTLKTLIYCCLVVIPERVQKELVAPNLTQELVTLGKETLRTAINKGVITDEEGDLGGYLSSIYALEQNITHSDEPIFYALVSHIYEVMHFNSVKDHLSSRCELLFFWLTLQANPSSALETRK